MPLFHIRVFLRNEASLETHDNDDSETSEQKLKIFIIKN